MSIIMHAMADLSSSLKVVEMHTWCSDWKRVIIVVIIIVMAGTPLLFSFGIQGFD
jgi:hypothetical protein